MVDLLASSGLDGLLTSSESPDVSIMTCRSDPSLVLVSSTDFFSPITLDPYKQGYIAAANTLSDLYAVGVTEVDSVLMLLGLSLSIPEPYSSLVGGLMMKGFRDCCIAASTCCSGGQTVLNPWPLVGGVASSVVRRDELIGSHVSIDDDVGHVIVLTKPLGTQIAGNLAIWMMDVDKWERVLSLGVDEHEASRAVSLAESNMMKLNRKAAMAAKQCGAIAATDVTGFGLLGHAENLALLFSKHDIVIEKLPVISGLELLERGVTVDYRLTKGYSAETSGGLLIVLRTSRVDEFMRIFQEPAWVIGSLIKGSGKAIIVPNPEIIKV